MSVGVNAGTAAAADTAGRARDAQRALAPTEATGESEERLGLTWLRKLRWGAVLGQVLIFAVVGAALGAKLPLAPLLGLVGFTALSNVALGLVPQRLDRGFWLPTVLAVDVVVLAALLAVSGGASNPFTVFFLVHVALASLLLDARLAWAVVLLTVGSFGALFLLPTDHSMMHHEHHARGGPWSGHLFGMWVAYAFAASFVAYFVGKVSRAIRERDHKLVAVTKLATQNERLATLSSFSASAAHELGSPLATIGLAAKELRLRLLNSEATEELRADAELVCQEVARCRQILADLSSRAGETVGEMPVSTTPGAVVELLQRLLSPRLIAQVRFDFADEAAPNAAMVAPVNTLSQMLVNLVRNAFEAQEEAGSTAVVDVSIRVTDQARFNVRDRGRGMPPELQQRLGEPFVTTKSEQGGLGLGIDLVRSYAERMGGSLAFHARPGGGADVELCLPRDSIRGATS